MNRIAIAIHGGASEKSVFLSKHLSECDEGLRNAVKAGYKILQKGGSAINAVECAVKILEDNELFNAGRGSALNNKGEIEMDASIMEGKYLKAGAVSMVRSVRNPIALARVVMTKTKHVLLSGYGALELAKSTDVQLETDDYFITDHQYQLFLKRREKAAQKKILRNKSYGTVGAVALDSKGNLASATSTGGISNSLPGRIGDSCIIGAGCYANNKTCAISSTGEGEIIIRGAVAHTISMLMELKKMPLKEACNQVIYERNRKAHIGVIGVNTKGQVAISFNTKIIKCAWFCSGMPDIRVQIYNDE